MSTRKLIDLEHLGVGVQMFKSAWFDSCAGDERVNFVFLKSNDTPELVRRQRAFIDELVESPQRDAQARRSVACAQPTNLRRTHGFRVPGVTRPTFATGAPYIQTNAARSPGQ